MASQAEFERALAILRRTVQRRVADVKGTRVRAAHRVRVVYPTGPREADRMGAAPQRLGVMGRLFGWVLRLWPVGIRKR